MATTKLKSKKGIGVIQVQVYSIIGYRYANSTIEQNKIKCKDTSITHFLSLIGPPMTLLTYTINILTSIILKEAGESSFKLFAFIDLAKNDFQ